MQHDGSAVANYQVTRPIALTNVTHVQISSRADDIRAGLIDTFLNLEMIDNDIYLSRHLLKGRQSIPAVYGGQVIGQALAAAAATVDDSFKPHSFHSYFIQAGSVHKPILYMIDRVSDRRSFCTRIVKAVQSGKAIFTCQASFHKDEPDAIAHQHKMPDVSPPEKLIDYVDLMEKYSTDSSVRPAIREILKYRFKEISPAFDRIFQLRPVDPERYVLDLDGKGIEPRTYLWLRAKENIGDDPRLHQCVAAYISDCTMLDTAMKSHTSDGFAPTMAFSLDHCIWMHSSEFRVDEWMLYENYRGSRGFTEGRLWSRDGRLILSTAQEGLIRSARSKDAA
ncbi:unnamed protein product [Enterobius vermicularis]|uniref:Acyl-CoA thioesterase II n=1 Tax=Enterobius vermicularis TaxID=51028 RepID=A0A3P6ID13_ENTVE|nr:unnamed protein product [Enterobius vermicularis]